MAIVFRANQVFLGGRLATDPKYGEREAETAEAGPVKRCSFRLAVARRRGKSERNPETDFVTVTAWGRKAEVIANYFHKGDPIFVSGELRTYSYTDRTGGKRDAFEVELEDFTFIESPRRTDPTETEENIG